MKPKHEIALDVLKRRDQQPTRVTLDSGQIARIWNIAWGYDAGESVAHVMTNVSPTPDEEHSVDFFRADEIRRIEDPEEKSILFSLDRCPRFRARLKFHFKAHGPERRRFFVFGDDLYRRAPMKVDGIEGEGLNTVSMWVARECKCLEGDSVEVDCDVVVDSLLDALLVGTKFHLWDGGFFATGVVLAESEGDPG